jgi:putative salt-induced outer membrane protein
MMGRSACAVVVLSLGLLRGVASAQQPVPPPPPPEREGSAEFAFVGTSGNASTETLGVGGEYIYRPSPWESRVKLRYVRNESEDVLNAQSFVLLARAQRPVGQRLAGYGQYGYQRDRFAGILNRNTIEGGATYSWINLAPHKLTVDAGLGYANERRLIGNSLSTATLNTGGLYLLKLSPTSEISEDGRFVFSLSESSDWRYANTVALTAKVTTIFSLKLANAIRFVNAPVFGFKSTDVITSIALVAKF